MKFHQKQFMQRRAAAQIGQGIRVLLHGMVMVGKREPEEDFFENPWRLKVPTGLDGQCLFCSCYVLPERGVVDQTPENIPETTFGYHNETTEENAGESGRAPPIITQRVFRPLANSVLVLGLTCHVTDRCTCQGLPDRPGEP